MSYAKLHTAAKAGDCDTIRKLLDEGVEVDAKDKVRHETSCPNQRHARLSLSRASLVARSLARFIDTLLDDRLRACAQNALTALHYAALKGKVDAVALLMDRKLDPNITDECGLTPLHYAAGTGRTSVAGTLGAARRAATPLLHTNSLAREPSHATPLSLEILIRHHHHHHYATLVASCSLVDRTWRQCLGHGLSHANTTRVRCQVGAHRVCALDARQGRQGRRAQQVQRHLPAPGCRRRPLGAHQALDRAWRRDRSVDHIRAHSVAFRRRQRTQERMSTRAPYELERALVVRDANRSHRSPRC